MSKSLDLGTMFLVKGEISDVTDDTTFTIERNAFLQASTDSDTEEILKENNWSYVKYNDKYYILGEDAINLKNLLTVDTTEENRSIVSTKVGELRRPMKDGILNTSEEKLSVAIIQKIIGNLVGKPKEKGEHLCFCVPGDPIDKNFSVLFHKTMITGFLSNLGYTVESIPEALAIIFSERPTTTDPNTGEEAAFSGVSISMGAGMMNCVFCWKKMPLINFSITRSGDWLDQQAAKTCGINVSAMTRFKEKHFDLNKVDYSDMRQASLDIYYQNAIKYALERFSQKFNQLDNQIDAPLDIIIAGGTASVPGFLKKFKIVLDQCELPFKVKEVKLAENPLYTVSNGCLVKAIASEQKSKKKK